MGNNRDSAVWYPGQPYMQLVSNHTHLLTAPHHWSASWKKDSHVKRTLFNSLHCGYVAGKCKSRNLFQHCRKKHHTSICEGRGTQNTNPAILPVPVMMLNPDAPLLRPLYVPSSPQPAIELHVLLDSGSQSSYIADRAWRHLKHHFCGAITQLTLSHPAHLSLFLKVSLNVLLATSNCICNFASSLLLLINFLSCFVCWFIIYV